MAELKLDDPGRKYVLLVEGYSDLHFYAEMLEHLNNLHASTFIKHFNGKPDMERQVRLYWESDIAEVMAGENPKTSIGLIVDADTKPSQTGKRFSKLLGDLAAQDVKPGVWTDGDPRVGLYVAPDGKSKGEIETLVWDAWQADAANTEAKVCIEDYMDCMAKTGIKPKSRDKALVGALLAIANDEDPRLGPGARTRKVFDFDGAKYKPLRDFLSRIEP